MAIKIAGTGSYLPQKVLTNHDLEKMVDTSDEWIKTRTGIVERRIADTLESSSDMAFKASIKAMEMADITAEELDFIIVATITGDRIIPSTACILQKKLGASNAFCFDIQAACTGLIYAIEIANSMIASGNKYKRALIVGVEKLSSITDWADRNTCVLFGDGASAIVLEKRKGHHDVGGILASKLASNGNYADILQVPAGGSEMPLTHELLDKKLNTIRMEGQEVFKLAVNEMAKACKDVISQTGISVDEIRWLIPHQANKRIIEAVGTRLGISPERVYVNLQKYGNTSAASVGIALDEIVRNKLVERGDYILVTAFGSGLTWGSTLLKW
ncbi:MAG TPA: beta-ketoacyl-ACP synthase III [Victivallales bacterium]|nr:beta-ketoacyl-ACP synthase III [Victivallales bacterium]HPO90472.1 beta-ketoacyl-ACP synthase III [Victivallales bacterium]HRR06181.1 beta-ketoacyl-ACP synthase III [Victivallales bacterium]HRR28520.1 beta-ketoacyl-ACP synthase III [Victivallales bacterium]